MPPFEIWNGPTIDRGSDAWSFAPTAPPDPARPMVSAFAAM